MYSLILHVRGKNVVNAKYDVSASHIVDPYQFLHNLIKAGAIYQVGVYKFEHTPLE